MGERPQDKTVVEMWANHWFLLPKLLEPIKEQAREFTSRYPEYEVRVTGVDVRTMLRDLEQAVKAGRGPQLVTVQYLWMQHARDMRDAAGKPAFTSITEALDGRTAVLAEPVVVGDLVPNMARSQTIDGKLQAWPRNPSTTLLYANMTILREAGVSEPPRTWQEIDLACEAVARLRGRPSNAITWPKHPVAGVAEGAGLGAQAGGVGERHAGQPWSVGCRRTGSRATPQPTMTAVVFIAGAPQCIDSTTSQRSSQIFALLYITVRSR